MINLLRADWRKLTHRWMPRILIIIMLALVALIFLTVSGRPRFRAELVNPDGLVFALSLASAFAAFIWAILAGNWAGSEYGWGTIRLVLTRKPSRIEFTLSGFIMMLLTVGFGLLLVLLVGGIAGWLVGSVTNTPAAPAATNANGTLVVIKMFFAAWFSSAFYVALAYAAGTLFRSATAGVGVGIGFAVAQSAIAAIFRALGDPWKTIALHFPDSYTTALTSRIANELVITGPVSRVSSDAPGVPASLIGVAIYIGVLIAIMLVAVQRRDVTA